jgi:thymidylate synthase|tara:strand:+ start:190 stop:942 length:753 start_codon:yes stop_codon:yes gene_type:complete
MRELQNVQFSIPTKSNWVNHPSRNASKRYSAAEMIWYLTGSSSGTLIRHYAPSYRNYLEYNGHAWGAYGRRWKEGNQFEKCFNLLKSDTYSRRAVITCYDQRDVGTNAKDIPCTLTMQFSLRGALNLTVTMRSNDLWFGFPYDIFCFTSLQKMLAHSLGVNTGFYTHQVGSLHLYEQHIKRCDSLSTYKEPPLESSKMDCFGEGWPAFNAISNVLIAGERNYRKNGECAWESSHWEQDNFASSILKRLKG